MPTQYKDQLIDGICPISIGQLIHRQKHKLSAITAYTGGEIPEIIPGSSDDSDIHSGMPLKHDLARFPAYLRCLPVDSIRPIERRNATGIHLSIDAFPGRTYSVSRSAKMTRIDIKMIYNRIYKRDGSKKSQFRIGRFTFRITPAPPAPFPPGRSSP
jgi:hypothetical protein